MVNILGGRCSVVDVSRVDVLVVDVLNGKYSR